jgi:hypothetical protein
MQHAPTQFAFQNVKEYSSIRKRIFVETLRRNVKEYSPKTRTDGMDGAQRLTFVPERTKRSMQPTARKCMAFPLKERNFQWLSVFRALMNLHL